jgi:hypothetical protein
MRQVMVRYRVKAGEAAHNEELVRDVHDELHAGGPAGIRYATFKLDDGLTFIHVAATRDGQNPLATVAAFQRFQDRIGERCQEPPVVSELTEVGSYRLFDDEG